MDSQPKRSLIDLARQLYFHRPDAMDRSGESRRKARLVTLGSSIVVVVGATTLIISLILNSSQQGALWWSPALGVAVTTLGILGIRRSISQSLYRKATTAIDLLSRFVATALAVACVPIALVPFVLLVGKPAALGQSVLLLSWFLAVSVVVLTASAATSKIAIVRADAGRPIQHDSTIRIVSLWIAGASLVWVLLHTLKAVQDEFQAFGLVELMLIIAFPVVLGYVNHRSEVRRRLVALAGVLGEMQAVIGDAFRIRASLESKSRLRISLVRLQTLVHANRTIKFGLIPVRTLVDDEISLMIDFVTESIGDVDPLPGSEIHTQRGEALRELILTPVTAAEFTAFVREVRRRALRAL